MNEELRELLSAYLDNQVSDEQRQRVEGLLKTDPEVRKELDEMRTFCEHVTQSKPAAVPVPDDFRQSIMNRLAEQVPADQKSNKQDPPGGAGLGGLMKNKMLAYILSGTVLVGLIGTFAYLDKQNSSQLDQAQKISTDVLKAHQDKVVELPDYKGEYKGQMKEGSAQPGDIESVVKDDTGMGKMISNNDLSGSVYVQGKGGSSRGSSPILSQLQSNGIDPSSESFVSKRLMFESRQDWTVDTIKDYYNGKNPRNVDRAEAIMDLANKNNLNPGLLIAAMQSKPEIDILDAAPKIRSVLDANQGISDKEKLNAIIEMLDGSPDWVQKWEAFLR